MVVKRSIPLATDILAVSQGDLLGNAQGYFDTFAVDHGGYDSTVPGFHKKTTYPVQAAIPVTTAGQSLLYSDTRGNTASRADLFYVYGNSDGKTPNKQVFPINFVKACCVLIKTGSGFIPASAFNIASVTYGASVWNVTFTNPIAEDSTTAMIFTTGNGGVITYAGVNTRTTAVIHNPQDAVTACYMMVCSLDLPPANP